MTHAPHRRPFWSPTKSQRLRVAALSIAGALGVHATGCSSASNDDRKGDQVGNPMGSGGGPASGTGGMTSIGSAASGGSGAAGGTGGSHVPAGASGGGSQANGGAGAGAGGTPETGGASGRLGGNTGGAGLGAGSGGRSAGGGAGSLPGGAGGGGASDPNRRHLLLRDEAQSMVSYVEMGNPSAGWHVVVPYGRDLQLVGGGRFLIGTDNGYEERTLTNGALVTQQNTYAGTQTAHRLRNGDTILAGADWQGGSGIILVELNPAGMVARRITYPGFNYVRLIRQTPTGTFLVTADTVVFEGDATGKILWRATVVGGPASPHVWQALRVPSGDTVVTTGYAASIEIFGPDGIRRQTITGPASVTPNFYAALQILPNGNFVVANWLGHMGEVAGVQLLEYNPAGALVWSYRPNATTESLSLHHVIVLDGLDVSKLHVDDTTGVLVPVP